MENHQDTLIGLTRYLEQMDHEVFSASTMNESLAALRKIQIDILLSDIGLPDGSGWELLQRANLPESVYAVAMSGFGMNADRARSKAAGYRRHLLKPFDPQILDEILAEVALEQGLP
ncbi:MAG TPA: response regulator [Chthoniobacteraceae bacterium]|nr:response regulator [Chthoniobacteraceae bacterium]